MYYVLCIGVSILKEIIHYEVIVWNIYFSFLVSLLLMENNTGKIPKNISN